MSSCKGKVPWCYRTLRLRCLMGTMVRWWLGGMGRGRREEEEEGGGALLYCNVPRTFPKWTAFCSCLFHLSG
ncbi:hypothetical protein PDIP_59460 [Penicillium digitatum Pd1]|uniref:Uncharacterized protein n=1 Tax=Penicillium digitatum (strain Pd1 / CECT 20795) TaxID=1170230 RepID=K9FLT8_PEND1|nr:hypothetical protein PDIP_59460 [Penicillium digitatum Pd1]EKV10565.1 hypothetical protein PDIP_59460 [Penicillium digitatum Pd1]